jgi:L-ascorbate metabolism protein UlaG (beta-lactamase superfamily)
MKITKFGHCCLLIKLDKLTVLTDPGAFSSSQNSIQGIDIILITHEHPDHFHVESLKQVLENNPKAQVVTNSGVGAQLKTLNIPFTLVEKSALENIGGVDFHAFDGKHEEIFGELGQVQNTGYFIDGKLFYPGDSFCDPQMPIDILALPVAGPWCKIPDAIRYALKLKPKKAFPVHDGMLDKARIGSSHGVPKKILSENGIEFIVIEEGQTVSF